jgi:hypothetical protein
MIFRSATPGNPGIRSGFPLAPGAAGPVAGIGLIG